VFSSLTDASRVLYTNVVSAKQTLPTIP
jgi:hypothetical protein